MHLVRRPPASAPGRLIHRTGTDAWRTAAIMTVAALFSGLVGTNGAVAPMLPAIVVAVRTGPACQGISCWRMASAAA